MPVRFSDTSATIKRDNQPEISPHFPEDPLPATISGTIFLIKWIIKQKSHSFIVLTTAQRAAERGWKLNFQEQNLKSYLKTGLINHCHWSLEEALIAAILMPDVGQELNFATTEKLLALPLLEDRHISRRNGSITDCSFLNRCLTWVHLIDGV